MKIFKFIICAILTALTIQTGYLALLYKVEIATSTFLIVLGMTLLVMFDGGLKSKYATNKK